MSDLVSLQNVFRLNSSSIPQSSASLMPLLLVFMAPNAVRLPQRVHNILCRRKLWESNFDQLGLAS